MITFKTINNQLYRIFDEPKTITTDNNNTEAYRVSNKMRIAIKTMLNNQK